MQRMPEWLPTRATARGRLVLAALEHFGARGYDAVNVADLARAAATTTGPLYHHFGSKRGLYDVVRGDVERRLTDRMEGALAAQPALAPALVVAFDYAQRAGFLRLVGEPQPGRRRRCDRRAADRARRRPARRDARRRVASGAAGLRRRRRAGGGPRRPPRTHLGLRALPSFAMLRVGAQWPRCGGLGDLLTPRH
jgi:AcrR family transcriptional regulator